MEGLNKAFFDNLLMVFVLKLEELSIPLYHLDEYLACICTLLHQIIVSFEEKSDICSQIAIDALCCVVLVQVD